MRDRVEYTGEHIDIDPSPEVRATVLAAAGLTDSAAGREIHEREVRGRGAAAIRHCHCAYCALERRHRGQL